MNTKGGGGVITTKRTTSKDLAWILIHSTSQFPQPGQGRRKATPFSTSEKDGLQKEVYQQAATKQSSTIMDTATGASKTPQGGAVINKKKTVLESPQTGRGTGFKMGKKKPRSSGEPA